ncbi:hypothetical protein DLAC_03886 [Tieghemostelium lacteum]|uniref:Carbohydrate kinase n=1 Tax=Tieghemostelium lacteum TaxID=361077 RepID=A0A152A122_TIELA|nr:hypothetical protein DLAC_03886 [Tieghemostelium lacteum]|eukprot:KYQ99919.1 hypothetical protein DLAC_03886 [Tieghemostelium lacteum]
MYLIGYDVGSSSVKASLIDSISGKEIVSDYFPKDEMKINAPHPLWAEQDPQQWWSNLKLAHHSVITKAKSITNSEGDLNIIGIGISFQMHGLVIVDKDKNVLRPSIIWCDSRAVGIGEKAFESLGRDYCLSHFLNSPGNFTASKLSWVKENEPEIFKRIYKFMLPGDYIAMKLTGEITTTIESLSEAVLWDFQSNTVSEKLLNYFGIPNDFIPDIKPVFGVQGTVSLEAALELSGIKEGVPVTYRSGDQPNNAFSLNVMKKGELASTAGTSGVVYGVLDHLAYDKQSRVNTFAHVNYNAQSNDKRLGVLLCINGTGILYSWLKRNLMSVAGVDGESKSMTYDEMNELSSQSPIGSKGLLIVPFGNGSERILSPLNYNSCTIHGINFNIHCQKDILRAAQEGIAYAYELGMEIMRDMGMDLKVIRACSSNMFKSKVFLQTLSNISGVKIEIYNTDGSTGAARGAGVGCGVYKNMNDAFQSLEKINEITPILNDTHKCKESYNEWKHLLNKIYK